MMGMEFKEISSNATHTWIEAHEYSNSSLIGMVLPVTEGFVAIGKFNDEKFDTFEDAKQFIINAYKEEKSI